MSIIHKNMRKYQNKFKFRLVVGLLLLSMTYLFSNGLKVFLPGEIWPDNRGKHINAHGGGILYHNNMYYWYGEHKNDTSNAAYVGVNCYSSKDFFNWKYEGVALPVSNDENSPIVAGSIIERPKVIYNKKNNNFVMWFHLELKGQGYAAAMAGLAVSDSPVGPFEFKNALRPNAGKWPLNMPEEYRALTEKSTDFNNLWSEPAREAIEKGLFVRRDFDSGQMSRDMTLYVDEDNKAYHIFSSEENRTIHIAELSADYQSHTGRYIRVAPNGHNEAPAIFKHKDVYYLFASGCTGWKPNKARLYKADAIMGNWEYIGDPCKPSAEEDASKTFHSQSTYVVKIAGKENAFVFMADRWRPELPIDGRYVWLPVLFENDVPYLNWFNSWDFNVF
jgi:hypothetical protein